MREPWSTTKVTSSTFSKVQSAGGIGFWEGRAIHAQHQAIKGKDFHSHSENMEGDNSNFPHFMKLEPLRENTEWDNQSPSIDNLFHPQFWDSSNEDIEPKGNERFGSNFINLIKARDIFKTIPRTIQNFLFLARSANSKQVSPESKENIKKLLHGTGFDQLLAA